MHKIIILRRLSAPAFVYMPVCVCLVVWLCQRERQKKIIVPDIFSFLCFNEKSYSVYILSCLSIRTVFPSLFHLTLWQFTCNLSLQVISLSSSPSSVQTFKSRELETEIKLVKLVFQLLIILWKSLYPLVILSVHLYVLLLTPCYDRACKTSIAPWSPFFASLPFIVITYQVEPQHLNQINSV